MGLSRWGEMQNQGRRQKYISVGMASTLYELCVEPYLAQKARQSIMKAILVKQFVAQDAWRAGNRNRAIPESTDIVRVI
jgi:hypothetical protein